MEFTTHLELHSQATRLYGNQPYASARRDGVGTLFDTSIRGELTTRIRWLDPSRLQFGFPIYKLSSSLFTRSY